MINLAIPIRGLLIAMVIECLLGPAYALDPDRSPSQYVRQEWSADSGLLASAVHAIGQSLDGYLWIGTDKGLIRFDGFNFLPAPLQSSITQNDPILGITTDSQGELWVRTQAAGIFRYTQGRFESVGSALGASLNQVTAMSRDNAGGALFSDLSSGLLRMRAGKAEVLASAQVLPGSAVTMSMTAMPDGRIWLGTLGVGLFYLENGKATRVTAGLPERKINCLLSVGNDELWVGTDHGLFHWSGNALTRVSLPDATSDIQVLTLLQDRDSNVWVGTSQGLLRSNAKGISFSWQDSVREDAAVNALFEDREGDIWVGGPRGLERIRDSAFLSYSSSIGLPSDHIGPIYVDSQNRVWFAPIEGGLYLMNDGKVQPIRVPGMSTDVVYSITAGDHDSIWLGRQQGGITRLRFADGVVTEQTYTAAEGLAQNSVYSVYQSRDGGVWAGTLSGGVSELKDGRFVTYTAANGLGTNTVAAIFETTDGTMWFATPNGLSSLSNGHWKTYGKADGLPSQDVNCLYQDSSGVLWIGTSGGLAFFKSGKISMPRSAPASIQQEIFGIAEDRNNGLWVATSQHVLRLQIDHFANGVLTVDDNGREYSLTDGLLSLGGVKRNSSVVADSSGKIWFSMSRGLSVIDPAHDSIGIAPAIAHIESVVADGKAIDVSGDVRIPPSRKRLTFGFTGISLAIPERVRFRYMLDGFDRRWSDPVETREAVYTNLTPGHYTFRLLARNSAGLWNGTETRLAFEVEPALWETWWFRLLSLAIVGSLGLFAYQFRLHTLTRQLNTRFEERLAERTRIAQELHDTLLQGVLSASMQLHVASDQLETHSPARPLVNRVLELLGHVVEDGRNAIRGLRLSKEGSQDLDQAFSRIPQELPAQTQADFRVVVEGTSRALHPVIRDEVYRIGREAVGNAFRHSGATNIRVELEYGAHEFRLLVQDDGCGIDSHLLRSGRDGHWGLSGMRERSEKIGAKLKVWSKVGDGTEVDLRVPARVAFTSNNAGGVARWFSRIRARRNHRHDKDEVTKSQR